MNFPTGTCWWVGGEELQCKSEHWPGGTCPAWADWPVKCRHRRGQGETRALTGQLTKASPSPYIPGPVIGALR